MIPSQSEHVQNLAQMPILFTPTTPSSECHWAFSQTRYRCARPHKPGRNEGRSSGAALQGCLLIERIVEDRASRDAQNAVGASRERNEDLPHPTGEPPCHPPAGINKPPGSHCAEGLNLW